MSHHRIFFLQPLDDGLRLHHAPLLDLLKLWYARREADGLPSRRSLDMQALKPFLPHVFIAECETVPADRPAREYLRWRYRLIGTAIVEACGRDATGKYIDELYRGAELGGVMAALSETRQGGMPRSLHGNARFAGRAGMELETLLLPIGMPAGQNAQVIGAAFFRYAEPARPVRRLSRIFNFAA
ncbi:MAG TPA: PAS domain-containing protein [Ferrovibrio sp.]|uniref:PAS domain-containing protein n=1 Tax=Ferrovibrio sp. TaxID=1917215 RepID=UPI002ED5F6C3